MTSRGPIHLGYRLGHLKNDPQIFRAVVYDKGAYVLHMLRAIVGDEAFRRGLITFQAAHRFAKAGTDDLREALEKASGKELRPYFDTWVLGTTLPRLRLSSRTSYVATDYVTTVDVTVEGLPRPVPLLIALDLAEGKDLREVELGPEGGHWTFETAVAVRRVGVNDDRALLAWIKH